MKHQETGLAVKTAELCQASIASSTNVRMLTVLLSACTLTTHSARGVDAGVASSCHVRIIFVRCNTAKTTALTKSQHFVYIIRYV